jgi:hypothetical protein
VHTPLSKLISFALSGLIRAGVYDSAFQLWLRVTNNGHLTNRDSIEQLIQRVAASSTAPPEELVARVHQMMVDNRWHSSARYYALALGLVRQQLTWATSETAFRRAFERFNRLMHEASTQLGELRLVTETDLHVVALQCLVAAAETAARSFGGSAGSIRSDALGEALALYTGDLNHALSLQKGASLSAGGSAVDKLVGFIERLHEGEVGNTQARHTSLFSHHRAAAAAAAPEALSHKLTHDDLTRASSRLDLVTTELLSELAREGSEDGIATVLSAYLTHREVQGRSAWVTRTLPLALRCYGRGTLPRSVGEICALASKLLELATPFQLGDASTAELRNRLVAAAVSALPLYSSWTELAPAVEATLSSIGSRGSSRGRVNGAVIAQLSRYGDSGDALLLAADRLAADGDDTDAVTSDMLVTLLRSATLTAERPVLRRVLKAVAARAAEADVNTLELQLARLYATSRLGNGLASLLLLREIQELTDKRVPLNAFTAVANSLFFFEPRDKAGMEIVLDPKTSSEYLRELMLRQGHNVSAETMVLLLKLYTKAAKTLLLRKEDPTEIYRQAKEFCETTIAKSPLSLSAEEQEGMWSGLIKMYCSCGDHASAIKLLRKLEAQRGEAGLGLSAVSFEPVMYLLCCIKLDIVRAEDLLTSMSNKAVAPSTAIVDSFVKGIGYTDVKAALDRSHDLYNQHNVRPSLSCMQWLLRRNLEARDVYESRRVVGAMEQFGILQSAATGPQTAAAIISRSAVERIFDSYGMRLSA